MNVAVPLVSAAIAGLVAWIVARHRGRTARENGVLDKRYSAYSWVLSAANELLSSPVQKERAKDSRDPRSAER